MKRLMRLCDTINPACKNACNFPLPYAGELCLSQNVIEYHHGNNACLHKDTTMPLLDGEYEQIIADITQHANTASIISDILSESNSPYEFEDLRQMRMHLTEDEMDGLHEALVNLQYAAAELENWLDGKM